MIEQLISKTWALEPRFHNAMAAQVLKNGLDKSAFEAARAKHVPYMASPTAGHYGPDGKYHSFGRAAGKEQSVAVIPIIGSITRYGEFCSYGAEDYANWILEANQLDYISSIVLELNTPGGEADGIEMLGNVIKQSAKPVVAYVAGMAASAGYWLASQCREIVMESLTSSFVGSIGVLSMHVNAAKYYEKEGYSITIIRSDGSEDKALFNSLEPLSAEILSDVKVELNMLREAFIKTVKAGRPGISGNVFSGKMYPGKEAIKLGMADKTGYLGYAVKRADQLSRKV